MLQHLTNYAHRPSWVKHHSSTKGSLLVVSSDMSEIKAVQTGLNSVEVCRQQRLQLKCWKCWNIMDKDELIIIMRNLPVLVKISWEL